MWKRSGVCASAGDHGGMASAGIAGSVLCLCTSVLAGNALLGAAQSNHTMPATGPATRPVQEVQPAPAQERDVVIVVPQAKPLPTPTPVVAPVIVGAPEVSPTPEVKRTTNENQDQQGPDIKTDSRESPDNEPRGATAKSYIDGLKAEGVTDLSIEALIAMKVQNVTPEYVHSIRALGLKPDANELIAMRVQGVTPEVIRELRNGGLMLEIGQIIAMQVQGVTPEYVKQLHDLGILTDADNVLAMKVQGITSEYVREMREGTASKLSGGELVAMKVQGVTAEYVREIKALGFHVDADDIIAMKVQGVTAEYIKALQSAGLKLDTRGVMEAKVQGITPEFIEKARKHGFQNLSVDKLMALKHTGVLD